MIRIVTDSTASIPRDVAEENGIEVVSMYVNRNGVEYEDATMDVDAFYTDIYDMVDNIPTSSQPSVAAMEEVFERAAQEGDELIGIFMSSKMSGTIDNALRAARSVAARHAVGQHGVVKGQQFVDAEAVLLGLVDVLVHRVLVKLHCLRYLAVGHGAVPEQTENLL